MQEEFLLVWWSCPACKKTFKAKAKAGQVNQVRNLTKLKHRKECQLRKDYKSHEENPHRVSSRNPLHFLRRWVHRHKS